MNRIAKYLLVAAAFILAVAVIWYGALSGWVSLL